MNMKKYLSYSIVFLMVFTTNHLFAQKFLNGSIVFKDGKVLKGLVEYPSNFKTPNISFKENETAKEQEFPSEEIKTVTVKESGEDFEFHRGTYYEELTFRGKVESKERWLVVLVKGPATLYTVAAKSVKIKEGKLSFTNRDVVTYYIKRDSEKIASDIAANMSGITAGLNEDFRDRASKYFQDYPELVKKINAEKLKIDDIFSVVEEYNSWANSKKKKKK
jgi:hypothetical protein